MKIKCENKSLLTFEDLCSGKLICFKLLIGLILFIGAMSFLTVSILSSSWGSHYLSSILPFSILITSLVLFISLKRSSGKDSFLSIKSGLIEVHTQGEKTQSISLSDANIQLSSWSFNQSDLRPALEISGAQIGNLRIGVMLDELDWTGYKNIFTKTHYVIHDQNQWDQLKVSLKQYL